MAQHWVEFFLASFGEEKLCFYSIKIRLETHEIKFFSVVLLSQASLVVGCMLTSTYDFQAMVALANKQDFDIMTTSALRTAAVKTKSRINFNLTCSDQNQD